MTKSHKIKILGVGTYIPTEKITSDELFSEFKSELQYGIPENWMSEKMGIKSRFVSPIDTQPSELAIPAAQKAIENSKINPSDIDMLIFCGIERDCEEPATAHIIQEKIGTTAHEVFDLSNACLGFVDAMKTASKYIACGEIKYALITTGENKSRVLFEAVRRLKAGMDIKSARNIIGALSVGDAGGAVILGKSDDESGFNLFNTHVDSQHAKKCIYKINKNGVPDGVMLMGPISNAILKAHEGLIDDTLHKLGWNKFDWLLSHQMGKKPFDKLSLLKGVTESKMIKTFDKLGNITTATFPVNYEKLVRNGNVRAGQKIGCCFAGSGLAVDQIGYIL